MSRRQRKKRVHASRQWILTHKDENTLHLEEVHTVMRSTVEPAVRCAKQFSFAQCTACRAVFQVGQRGRLPNCSECGQKLSRVKHLTQEAASGK
jgi:rRNA maturation endonuclease Nob1